MSKVERAKQLTERLRSLPYGEGGCCLHIVVEDQNLDDDSVAFCIEQAKSEGHAGCLALAMLYAALSPEERGEASGGIPCDLCGLYWCNCLEDEG